MDVIKEGYITGFRNSFSHSGNRQFWKEIFLQDYHQSKARTKTPRGESRRLSTIGSMLFLLHGILFKV